VGSLAGKSEAPMFGSGNGVVVAVGGAVPSRLEGQWLFAKVACIL